MDDGSRAVTHSAQKIAHAGIPAARRCASGTGLAASRREIFRSGPKKIHDRNDRHVMLCPHYRLGSIGTAVASCPGSATHLLLFSRSRGD